MPNKTWVKWNFTKAKHIFHTQFMFWWNVEWIRTTDTCWSYKRYQHTCCNKTKYKQHFRLKLETSMPKLRTTENPLVLKIGSLPYCFAKIYLSFNIGNSLEFSSPVGWGVLYIALWFIQEIQTIWLPANKHTQLSVTKQIPGMQ